jgi:hemolysin activation/secretion protein
VTSAELRIAVFRLPIPGLGRTEEDGVVPIVPFADFGWGGNTDQPRPSPQTIYSISLGLRWELNQRIHMELYWGFALVI